MRSVYVLLSVLLIMGIAHALDVNAIDLNVATPVSSDFNVFWDVNNANNDWNHFIVSIVFGTVVQSDLDHDWEWNVGTDFNTNSISIAECNAEGNVYHCHETISTDGNFLRNGPFTVRVYGWKDDGNVFAVEQNSSFTGYSDISASVSGYSSKGELNVSVSFSCDVNADVNAFSVGGRVPSAVYDEGNTIILTFTDPPRFGDVLEVNRDDVNAACDLPYDTNTVVMGLPNDYASYSPGWAALVIPHEINRSYPYTLDALGEFNVFLYIEGNGWSLRNPLSNDYYTLRAYLAYTDHNVVVPWRYVNENPDPCPDGVSYVTLSAGWSLLPVYCYGGSDTCSEYNSSLYGLSFVEFNAEVPRATLHPFFSLLAPWNVLGGTPWIVYDFDTAPDVNNNTAYWVWINPNWLQGGLTAYYYGNCIRTPEYPPN